ncbi:hypothetical protein WJX79_001380 [Trebouxia sp. C0005]
MTYVRKQYTAEPYLTKGTSALSVCRYKARFSSLISYVDHLLTAELPRLSVHILTIDAIQSELWGQGPDQQPAQVFTSASAPKQT